MKKIIVSVLVLAMTLSLCACGEAKPRESTRIANPVHEVTAEGLLAATGLMLTAPERVASAAYSYIDRQEGSPIAQLSFTLDGTDCCYRAVSAGIPGDALTDISGMYYEWSSADSADVGYNSAELHWIEGAQGWIGWYDYAPGILYCLAVSSGASKELLTSLANELYAPAQGEADGEPVGNGVQARCIKDSGFLTADLDGDGKEDTVTILEWTADEFDNKEYGFSVEGGDGLTVVEEEMYICSKPVLWLADVDGDGLPEILFSGDSGSDDYYTGCFKWSSGVLNRIHFAEYADHDGIADGCVEDIIEGGIIVVGAYCYVLGTYGGTRHFAMGEDGTLRAVGSPWAFKGNECWLTASRELPVSLTGQPRTTIPAGTEILLFAFDGEPTADGCSTVYFITRDKTEGSMSVSKADELSGWMIDGVPENDCFDFLPYAG